MNKTPEELPKNRVWFPSIRELAMTLTDQKKWIEDDFVDEPGEKPFIEVRLQVEEGGWSLHTGDSQYDQDHRGFWGSGFLTRRTNCRDLSRDLIDQARDHQTEMEG